MADIGSLLGGLGVGGAIGQAIVRLELDTKKYQAEMNAAHAQTQASANGMSQTFTKFGGVATAAALGAGVAVAALVVHSAKAAIAFDQAFTRIAAISNASAADIAAWKEEVLSLAGETAKAPKELADALFFLASAGLDAAEVMPALEVSAKAAAAGLGETADVANIVASALNAYAGAGLTAAEVTDTLVAAVREGRAEPEEFAGALGRILPIAANIGVTFDQVAASMAVLSNIGLDVNEAVTAMRGVLQAVAAPGSEAAAAMKELGLSAQVLLDAISEDGIIGALRLLDQAAKDQTNTQAAYFGILRKVIPNVRSLTGALGLTGQEAEKVDDIFENVLDSTGSTGDAFRITAESDAFKLNQAMNDIAIAGEELAREVFPALADAAVTLAEVLGPVIENLDIIVALAAGAKLGLGAVGPAAAVGAGGFQELTLAEAEAISGMELGIETLGDWTGDLNTTPSEMRPAIESIEVLGKVSEKTGRNFSKAAKEIADSLKDEIPAIVGTATTYKETFTLSSSELVKIAASWARIARTIARDLREIGRSDLSPAMREAIAALPPEMRHAWVEGSAKERGAIQKSIRATFNVQEEMPKLAKQALLGGRSVGIAMNQGLITAIREGSSEIAAAAAASVTAAIAAARRAAAADSPSKKMMELGRDLMLGLQEGLTREEERTVAAAERVVERMIEAIERQIEQAQDRLSRVQGRAGGLRDAVRGGFSSFLDISGAFELPGADIGGFFTSQVAGAQQFADILKALQAQGASPALLQQIAGAGPQAIPFAQALLQQGPGAIGDVGSALQTIQQLAGQTAQGLSEAFFGEKIDGLRDELRELNRAMRILEKPQRLIVEFRGANPSALEQFILQVLAKSQMAQASL